MEKILLACCLLLPLFQLEAQVPIKEKRPVAPYGMPTLGCGSPVQRYF